MVTIRNPPPNDSIGNHFCSMLIAYKQNKEPSDEIAVVLVRPPML